MEKNKPAAAQQSERQQPAPTAKVGVVLLADCGKLGAAGAHVRVTEKARDRLVAQGKARRERPTDRGIFGIGI